jgi:hypothetical protein
MAEPTLRDMFRWSGGSHSPPTTLPGDTSQPSAPTSTIAQPISARQSEDKQRYSSGFSTTVPGSATDNVGTGVATNDFAPGSGATAPARDQTNVPNVPKKTTNSKTVAIDVTAISSNGAKASEKTEYKSETPVDAVAFRALLGYPRDKEPLPLSNVRQVAEAMDENRTPTSVKLPIRISTGKSTIPASLGVPSRGPSFLPRFLRRKPDAHSYETSVYYSLKREETKAKRLYVLYDVVTYVCLIAQLIIAAVLIILGALNADYHIAIATLGAVTGVITGILSMIRGQGLPQRLMRYADALRRVREKIEFTERELVAGVRTVTYGECLQLRTDYENIRDDETKNHPDTWTSWSSSTGSETPSSGKGADPEKGPK